MDGEKAPIEEVEIDVSVVQRQRGENPVEREGDAGLALAEERLTAKQKGVPDGEPAGVKLP